MKYAKNILFRSVLSAVVLIVAGVNYNDSDTDDNEKQLAREFGVAYQHTKVFVKDGARVLKSPESWNKVRYATEVAKAL